MSETLTPRQQMLLWDLVARGGSALQKDLKPDVERIDRESLQRAKLIAVAKARGFTLAMTDAGWDHVARVAPSLDGAGSKYDRPVLQFVLSRVQAYAAQNNVAFATLFAGRGTGPATTESAIEAAFFEIAGRPARGNIRLSQLRSRLGGFTREDVDATLVAMWKAGKANLMNLDNPRDIDVETAHALQTGIHTFHVVRIKE